MSSAMQGQHVLVLGLGHSGLAMARWCQRQQARVTVVDTRAAPPALESLRAQCPQAGFVHAELEPGLLDDASIRAIYLSPGLAPAPMQALLDQARQRGLPVGGELDLFGQHLQRLRREQSYAPAVLAVTGTNGKTTVTALTGCLLEQAGKQVAVAGNIGPSLLETLMARLDAQDLPDVWVLELSSFQLHAARDFEPTAATVLNISQDHLDWHGSMQAYVADKVRVFGTQSVMVLNRDDEEVMRMLTARSQAQHKNRAVIEFGAGLPQRAGDFGIETVHGMRWLVRAQQDDVRPGAKRKKPSDEASIHLQRLMPAEALRIHGRHNALNALAALALASTTGCSLADMLFALREYRGEPHRLQSLGMIDEVEYFEDSKGTNVGATVAALQGLGAERRLVVILGGDGKGQDFVPLLQPVSQFVRALVLIGRDAPLIRQALAAAGVPMQDCSNLPQAVLAASRQARAGDAVVLSPACASWDMFDSYVERAQVFARTVQELARERGVMLEGA